MPEYERVLSHCPGCQSRKKCEGVEMGRVPSSECRGYPDENALCTRCGRDEDAHIKGRVSSPTIPTVQSMFEQVVKYAKDDDERALLDLGFRTAFGLHPDYWHEYEVRLVPVAVPNA